MILLPDQQIELPSAGRAEFNNLSIPAQTLNQLADLDYRINVNVFSGRRSFKDNVLNCGSYDDTITKIQPGITLQCKLIGE